MSSTHLLLTFICIAVAFYLRLEWLAILLVIVLFFVALGSMQKSAPAPAPKAPQEILYPVIYEDVGESPYLYHPNTKLEVTPEWIPEGQMYSGVTGITKIVKIFTRLLGGKGK